MKKYFQITISLMLIGQLGACATTSESVDTSEKYYLLDASKARTIDTNKARKIKFTPINMPAYLDQPKLIIKESDHRISVADNHTWAESLKSATRRALRNDLNQASSDTAYSFSCDGCSELSISIDHFYPTATGDVELIGFYSIETDKGDHHQPFAFIETLEEDGFEHAVMKMRSLLKQLSSKIIDTYQSVSEGL